MRSISTFVLLLLINSTIVAQQIESSENNEAIKSPKNSIYVEFAGNGISYSLNYDYRIKEKIVARVGANYAPTLVAPGVGVLTYGSYLFGKEDEFFELGAGLLYVFSEEPALVPFVDNSGSIEGGILTGTIGYRYQSAKRPVLFKASLTPFYSFFADRMFISAGLSIGYTF